MNSQPNFFTRVHTHVTATQIKVKNVSDVQGDAHVPLPVDRQFLPNGSHASDFEDHRLVLPVLELHRNEII